MRDSKGGTICEVSVRLTTPHIGASIHFGISLPSNIVPPDTRHLPALRKERGWMCKCFLQPICITVDYIPAYYTWLLLHIPLTSWLHFSSTFFNFYPLVMVNAGGAARRTCVVSIFFQSHTNH